MDGFDVIVAGAGLGGLCLAAGLRRAGARVLVLERDAALSSRPQGYRINVNSCGDAALRACLPESHFELYRDTSHRQLNASVDVFSPDLKHLVHRMAQLPATGPAIGLAPSAVDRGVLRALLLDAAGDVRFGSEVADAASSTDGVSVRLSDGATLQADVLVAADGAMSMLRRRLLPGHDPKPIGTVAIYGRAPLEANPRSEFARRVLEQRFVGVSDGAGTTLALGGWRPRRDPAEAAAARVPNLVRHMELPATAGYTMCVLLCPEERAPGPESDAAALHRFALSAVSGWDPSATGFVREAIVADTFRVALRAMPSVPAWPTGRITFLGDAIHAMSPAGGEGANTALADAASLVACLGKAGPSGLADYERDMRRRAGEALDRSARFGQATAREAVTHG